MALRLNSALLAPILYVLYRIWCFTLSITVKGREGYLKARADGHHLVYALWHDELFPQVLVGKNGPWMTVVSQSKDGEFLTGVLERLGYTTVRGSSRRGGLTALRAAGRLMREKNLEAVLTVDGPTGPRHQVKEGVIYLAAKTPALIVPVRAYMSQAKVFNSWDRFQLPLPGSRCRVVFGEPYAVECEKLTAEVIKAEALKLEERLNALTYTGHA